MLQRIIIDISACKISECRVSNWHFRLHLITFLTQWVRTWWCGFAILTTSRFIGNGEPDDQPVQRISHEKAHFRPRRRDRSHWRRTSCHPRPLHRRGYRQRRPQRIDYRRLVDQHRRLEDLRQDLRWL